MVSGFRHSRYHTIPWSRVSKRSFTDLKVALIAIQDFPFCHFWQICVISGYFLEFHGFAGFWHFRVQPPLNPHLIRPCFRSNGPLKLSILEKTGKIEWLCVEVKREIAKQEKHGFS